MYGCLLHVVHPGHGRRIDHHLKEEAKSPLGRSRRIRNVRNGKSASWHLDWAPEETILVVEGEACALLFVEDLERVFLGDRALRVAPQLERLASIEFHNKVVLG